MKKLSLKAENRALNKQTLRDLKNAGKIPAVVYGGHIEKSFPVAVLRKDVEKIYSQSHNAILDLDVDGKKYTTVLTDVQKDIVGGYISHIDLHAVDPNDKLHIKVAVHLIGTAPGVKEGGAIEIIHREIQVECKPDDIPNSLDIDISNLHNNQAIHGNEIKLPKGVSYLHSMDNEIIVRCATPKVAVEAPAETAAVAPVAAAPAAAPAAKK